MAEQAEKKRRRGRPTNKEKREQKRKERSVEKEAAQKEKVENPEQDLNTTKMEEHTTAAGEPLEQPVVDDNTNPPVDDIPADEFDPLAEPVIHRDYTTAPLDDTPVSSEPIPEPTYAPPPMDNEGLGDEGGGEGEAQYVEAEEVTESDDGEGANPRYDDLSPAQKRKAAKKTADALILSYAKFIPLPFKKFSSFNMKKLERMEMQGHIRLGMEVKDDGTTVQSYVEDVNRQVEKTFTITPEMQDELREPLIDMIMEQGLALTPTQRLMLAIGGHLMTMTINTVQFASSNRDALKTFKEFHEDAKRGGAAQPPPQAQPETPPQPKQPPAGEAAEKPKEAEEYTAPTMDEYLAPDVEESDVDTGIQDVEVIEESIEA